MLLQDSKSIQKQKISPGQELISLDKPVKHLVLLHEGKIEARNAQSEFLYTLDKNSFPGFSSLLKQSYSPVRYIVSQPSEISAFPVSLGFKQSIMGKMNIGFMALRSLLNEIYNSYQVINKLILILSQIYKLSDNISLAYKCLVPEVFSKTKNKTQNFEDENLLSMQVLVEEFEQNGGQYPDVLNNIWLQTDNSSLLEKNYLFPTRFNISTFQFYRKLLSLPNELQVNIYNTDLSIMEGFAYQLKSLLEQNIQEIDSIREIIDNCFIKLLDGEFSFASKLEIILDKNAAKMMQRSLSERDQVIRYFCQAYKILQKEYSNISKLKNDSEDFNKVILDLESRVQVEKKEEKKKTTTIITQNLKQTARQIMRILDIPYSEQKGTLDVLARAKKI